MDSTISDPGRRTFIANGLAMTGASAGLGGVAWAQATQPFFSRHNLPIGIQTYTVGADFQGNPEGMFEAIKAAGYDTVETGTNDAKRSRAALDKAGLTCRSCNGGVDGDLGKLADDVRTMGADTVAIWNIGKMREVPRVPGEGQDKWMERAISVMSPDEFKWKAAYLNEKGAALKARGIRLAYHNHNFEFLPLGSTYGMEVMLANTDPQLVTFQMDIGWVVAGGHDPIALLKKHKGRFTLAHVKDVARGNKVNYTMSMDPTEVGTGIIDWAKVLPAAYDCGVRKFYVEQEAPFKIPRIQSAKISADYLRQLRA